MHSCSITPLFPDWILTDRKEDRISEYTNNVRLLHEAQLADFLKWVQTKILSIPLNNCFMHRFELSRDGNDVLGPFHIDIIVQKKEASDSSKVVNGPGEYIT